LKKPSTRDPLKRHAALPPKRHGATEPGTYVRKDGSKMKKKTLWFPAEVAISFAVYCAAHDVEESSFAVFAIQRAMKAGG
jgi:hypothetical protein